MLIFHCFEEILGNHTKKGQVERCWQDSSRSTEHTTFPIISNASCVLLNGYCVKIHLLDGFGILGRSTTRGID